MSPNPLGAETIDFMQVGVYDQLMEMTKGRGPDRCIDAVGAEAHSARSIDSLYDKGQDDADAGTDRPHVIREAIMCRPGGTISMPGVYLGVVDKIPLGAFMNRALTLKTGQTDVPRFHDELLRRVESGEIDPSFVILRTPSRSTRDRKCTGPSATRRTAASRWS